MRTVTSKASKSKSIDLPVHTQTSYLPDINNTRLNVSNCQILEEALPSFREGGLKMSARVNT